MDKKIKYDPFERGIQNKMNDFNDEYGKSWNKIAEKLDNKKKIEKRNLTAFLASLFITISIFTFVILSDSSKEIEPENKVLKKEQKLIEAELNSIEEIKNKVETTKPLEKEKTIRKQKPNQNLEAIKTTVDTIISKNISKANIDSNSNPIKDTSIIIEKIKDEKNYKTLKINLTHSEGCINDTFVISTLNNDSNAIKWYVNDILYGNNELINFYPQNSGLTKVILQQQIDNDSIMNYITIDSAFIKVFGNPLIDFTFETTDDNGIVSTYFTAEQLSLEDDEIFIKNERFENGEFLWNFGDGTESKVAFARHQYLENGVFTVQLNYSSSYGCSQIIEKNIEITSNFDILAPNSFTPNGDGKNDQFMPEGIKISGQPFEMKIFNKSGKIIFTTRNSNDGWNGFNQNTGNKCPNDNYMWVVEIQNINGNIDYFKGTILVLN